MNVNVDMSTAIPYQAIGDYLFPVIGLPNASEPIGHFGRLRKMFLKEHQPLIFVTMLLNGALEPHLAEVNRQAAVRKETLIRQMAAREGIDEDMKAADPMGWVQRMNNLRACAEEVVLKELVYE